MADKPKLKKKTVTTVTKVIKEEWELCKNLYYTRITHYKLSVDNSVEPELTQVFNSLSFKGKKINGYDITPLWKKDISILKKWNPFWGENKEMGLNKDYEFLKQEELPEPEDINIEDIIYAQSATHSFFDINLEPLPVVIAGDYIDARINNANYKLKALKEYLDKHPNVVSCSELLEVPHYNAGGDSGTKYVDVIVYPEVAWLKDIYANKKSRRDVFTCTWDDKHPDYLGMRQFMKPKIKEEVED